MSISLKKGSLLIKEVRTKASRGVGEIQTGTGEEFLVGPETKPM